MTTKTATTINLVNTALGAGMLAMPYAYRSQGIALATFNIAFFGLLTGIGLMLQVYISGFLPAKESSFFQACRITYPSLAIFFDLAIALKCFGVCVSYLVIAGSLMPLVTDYFGYETSRMTWLILSMVVVSPISFKKSLSSLKNVSVIALASVVYLLVIVIGHYLVGDTLSERGHISWLQPESSKGVITTIPIIVFAFTCAQNMFASINEMADRRVTAYRNVIIVSMVISSAVYVVIGLSGYLSFGDKVGDNIISMYHPSFWTTLGRLAIVLLVLFSYPLMFHPARVSIENILNAIRLHSATDETTQLLTCNRVHSQRQHVAVTVIVLVLSFVLASTLESLELILSFVGATGATSVSFILPGVFGYALSKSSRENDLVHLSAGQKKAVGIVSVLLFFGGLILATLAITININRLL